jgi:hypothetical protein
MFKMLKKVGILLVLLLAALAVALSASAFGVTGEQPAGTYSDTEPEFNLEIPASFLSIFP